MYTESARTPREKKGFTLACLAHSRPAAPTWRACQAWPARCCLVSATKLAAPVKKTGRGQNSKMKINMQTTCKICRALSTLSRGSLLALKLKSKYLWKLHQSWLLMFIFNLGNLFSKRSRASSTRRESARVPCQAIMFLNSLKADLETGVSYLHQQRSHDTHQNCL